jgi:hypothetical protein
VLFGIFVQAATVLDSENGLQAITIWRRHGQRAFEAEDEQQ